MVPKTSQEIAAATGRALAKLSAQLSADWASMSRDDDVARGQAGAAALDAVLEAADALKGRLVDGREGPSSEPQPHRSHA